MTKQSLSPAFRAKKSFGQNFLVNPHIKQKLIDACQISCDDIVIEIGPGKGAITEHLSRLAKQVIAIEADNELVPFLQDKFQNTNVTIIHADVLKHSFDSLPDNAVMVSNLPYNIATPVIEKAIQYRHKFRVFYMMVQLEYGARMLATVGSKDYSSFSCFIQYYGKPEMLFRIGRAAFQPMPKVFSCFLKYEFYKELPLSAKSESVLFTVIRTAFQQRRKSLINPLSRLIKKDKLQEILNDLSINSKDRAEEIALKDFIRIADQLVDLGFPSQSLNQ